MDAEAATRRTPKLTPPILPLDPWSIEIEEGECYIRIVGRESPVPRSTQQEIVGYILRALEQRERDFPEMAAERARREELQARTQVMRCAHEEGWPEREFVRHNQEPICTSCGQAQDSLAQGCVELCLNATWHSNYDYWKYAKEAREGGYEVPDMPPHFEF